MKFSELSELAHEDLVGRLRTSRRELYELRFKLAVGQQENHREIRKVRKDIARILTAIHRQELDFVEVEPAPPTEAEVPEVEAAAPAAEEVPAQGAAAPEAPAPAPAKAAPRRRSRKTAAAGAEAEDSRPAQVAAESEAAPAEAGEEEEP